MIQNTQTNGISFYFSDPRFASPADRKAITSKIQKDWGFKHLSVLHKARCGDIVKNSETDHGEAEYGLLFECRDGKIRTAWIMCDPEGNGPGHLIMQEMG